VHVGLKLLLSYAIAIVILFLLQKSESHFYGADYSKRMVSDFSTNIVTVFQSIDRISICSE